ncbi:MAG: FMN-dependent oxidoreductase, nitrilotriacetate monooxygenase family [Subtercola sp.]|nr:FMN-dependent oxidoreductase, nitrilotriacetate monooxygenase family [Subtercola sp.]
MFHLAWFTNPMPNSWPPNKWTGNDHKPQYWLTGEFYVDMAKALERGGFDYIMFEDHVTLTALDNPMPRLDPLTLTTKIADATKHIGVVSTISTSFIHPFGLARQLNSLDHLTGGRVGWNIVTTSEQSAAEAYGMPAMPPHDERYERANEYLEIATGLWERGWESDAVIMDATTGLYADPSKIHQLEYNGTWFSSKGSLNNSMSPQVRPVLSQAGTSGPGIGFAAKWADTVLTQTSSDDPLKMKAVRDSVRAEAIRIGRDPDEIKVLFWVSPVLGETDDIAKELHRIKWTPGQERIKFVLEMFTKYTEIDMFALDLDKVMDEVDVDSLHGHRATFSRFYDLRETKEGSLRTLREMISAYNFNSLDLVGTPSTVADQMQEAMEIVGGDGFLLYDEPLTRRYITEITEGLVPELRKRGLVRDEYTGATFRDNLLAF